MLIHGANFDGAQNIRNFSEFYDNAINDIAQVIIDYYEHHQKKSAAPPKIELNKMQQQHRAAVEQRFNELQQEKLYLLEKSHHKQ